MKILGLGGSVHDFSCCLLEDGRIVRAVEEERLSREKNARGSASAQLRCIDYCLDGGRLDDVDLIVTNDIFSEEVLKHHMELWRYFKINHHLSHAASSYFTSGWDEAAIMVIDGVGSGFNNSGEALSLGFARGNDIIIDEKYFGISLAKFYSHFMYICGFSFLQEGKVMGLAPYGTDTYVEEMSRFVEIDLPRSVDIHIYDDACMKRFADLIKADTRDEFSVKADIAYAVQYVFEESVIKVLQYLYEKTRCKKLCYAGGAALNSVLNGQIIKRTGFEEVYVFPAAGDSGTGIGAALYAYYSVLHRDKRQHQRLESCYFGKSYDKEIGQALDKVPEAVSFERVQGDALYDRTATLLSQGNIVGWFQDGSETGPRALGNRSILADPRVAEMKDILNKRVKFREHFRPFAPMVIKEKVKEYFEGINDNAFMLFVEQVRPEKQSVIPAVTHVDGSARLQTVGVENNPKMYKLLQHFEKITGVPVLLNTSFNIKGQPIVETPEDALEAFLHCDMDVLVMGDTIVTKKKKA